MVTKKEKKAALILLQQSALDLLAAARAKKRALAVDGFAVIGAALIINGVRMIYVPAAWILAGLMIAAIALIWSTDEEPSAPVGRNLDEVP